jgi:uncharacterized membrane protein YeaQ/YmgE (transglycosylase-associated protein family)
MNLVLTILIGVAIGIMVELLFPGHTMGELMLAMGLSVAGALLARYIGERGGWFGTEEPESFVSSALGAIVVLLIYGIFFRRSKRQRI